jgi:hypothetical protein
MVFRALPLRAGRRCSGIAGAARAWSGRREFVRERLDFDSRYDAAVPI